MRHPEVEVSLSSIHEMLDKKPLGIDRIESITEEPAVKPGENYGSVMKRLTIVGKSDSGTEIRRNVIMKKDRVVPKEEFLDVFYPEIKMYTEFLPKLKKLIDEVSSEECKVKLEVMWPDCYGVRNYDVLLLEDLKEHGFATMNRRTPLTPEIAIFIASQLGKFHALSLTAVERKIIDPKSIAPYKFAVNAPFLNNIWSSSLKMVANILESDAEWNSVVPKLREHAENAGTKLMELGNKMKDKFPVLCHGDCWTNNIMFKLSDDSSPKSLKFVDYQVSHYGCFAWDLVYIMNTSMTAQDKEKCCRSLVENYRTNLIQTLEALNQDTSSVPSEEQMHDYIKELGFFSLVISFSFFPLTINTMEKPWDASEALGDKTSYSHPAEIYENPKFRESLKLDLVRFKSQGLL